MKSYNYPVISEKYWQCQRWSFWIEAFFYMKDTNTLPSDGGYFDQDFLYMEVFNIIRNSYNKHLNEKKNG